MVWNQSNNKSPPRTQSLISGPKNKPHVTFTYEDLEEITGGFKEKLGTGSFTNVYKGVLASSHNTQKNLEKMVTMYKFFGTKNANCIRVARGLRDLHEECNTQIIH